MLFQGFTFVRDSETRQNLADGHTLRLLYPLLSLKGFVEDFRSFWDGFGGRRIYHFFICFSTCSGRWQNDLRISSVFSQREQRGALQSSFTCDQARSMGYQTPYLFLACTKKTLPPHMEKGFTVHLQVQGDPSTVYTSQQTCVLCVKATDR